MTSATKQDIQKDFKLFAKYVYDPKYVNMLPKEVFVDICHRIVEELENNSNV